MAKHHQRKRTLKSGKTPVTRRGGSGRKRLLCTQWGHLLPSGEPKKSAGRWGTLQDEGSPRSIEKLKTATGKKSSDGGDATMPFPKRQSAIKKINRRREHRGRESSVKKFKEKFAVERLPPVQGNEGGHTKEISMAERRDVHAKSKEIQQRSNPHREIIACIQQI